MLAEKSIKCGVPGTFRRFIASFEPRSRGPEPRILAKLDQDPVEIRKNMRL